MNTKVLSPTPLSSSHPAAQRALVLGGGGSTGNAWLIGVIAGLFDGGLDVTGADLIIGTSAGSTAAAQITGGPSLRNLLDQILTTPPPAVGPRATGQVGDQMRWTSEIIDTARDADEMRRRLGAAALERSAGYDNSARWRTTVANRLPSQHWPKQRVLITSVDAHSGEPVEFDQGSGVELADAVAASCASGFAYAIGDGRYIDGGYRTNADNADLAAGYARVLVLSPFGGKTRTPATWGLDLATQLEQLRAGGSRVETIIPDPAAEGLFGANAMDLSMRPIAAQAGHDQGRALADQLTVFWH